MKKYAGIGSRRTPMAAGDVIEELAGVLAERGYLLRSGGASGADAAFEMGCNRRRGAKGDPPALETVQPQSLAPLSANTEGDGDGIRPASGLGPVLAGSETAAGPQLPPDPRPGPRRSREPGSMLVKRRGAGRYGHRHPPGQEPGYPCRQPTQAGSRLRAGRGPQATGEHP